MTHFVKSRCIWPSGRYSRQPLIRGQLIGTAGRCHPSFDGASHGRCPHSERALSWDVAVTHDPAMAAIRKPEERPRRSGGWGVVDTHGASDRRGAPLPSVSPPLLRPRDAAAYLGMNKNNFNWLVRQSVRTIPLGSAPSPSTDLNWMRGQRNTVVATAVPPARRDDNVETKNARALQTRSD